MKGLLHICTVLLLFSTLYSQELHVVVPSPPVHKTKKAPRPHISFTSPLYKIKHKKFRAKKKRSRIAKRVQNKKRKHRKNAFVITSATGNQLDQIQELKSQHTQKNIFSTFKLALQKSRVYVFENNCSLKYVNNLQDSRLPYHVFVSNCLGNRKIRIKRDDWKIPSNLFTLRDYVSVDAYLRLEAISMGASRVYWRWKGEGFSFNNPFIKDVLKMKQSHLLKKGSYDATQFSHLIKRLHRELAYLKNETDEDLLENFFSIAPTGTRIRFSNKCPLIFDNMYRDDFENYIHVFFHASCFPKKYQKIELQLLPRTPIVVFLSQLKMGDKVEAKLGFHKIVKITDKYYLYWNTIVIKGINKITGL